jgi:hypothetical protein
MQRAFHKIYLQHAKLRVQPHVQQKTLLEATAAKAMYGFHTVAILSLESDCNEHMMAAPISIANNAKC